MLVSIINQLELLFFLGIGKSCLFRIVYVRVVDSA